MPMPTTPKPKPPHHPRGEKIVQMLNGVNTRCALYGHAACSGWRRAFTCARRRRFPPARLALPVIGGAHQSVVAFAGHLTRSPAWKWHTDLPTDRPSTDGGGCIRLESA
uniref:Uncharacterized protein n=1 Tax=Globodera rostochiensis TaxID=31243 RepID=A0A914I0Z2_GLORO